MTEFIKSMRYLINNSTDPYFNLAFDEYCLENIHSEEPYFFLWRNRPAVIIGLNQNAYGEVNLEYLNANGITLARRVTGGGAVYHDLQNMNYTIIGRNPSPQPMVDALRQLGVPAELTGRNDIFVEGRKVSGYARRVAGNQEIIHGTLMYDVDLDTLQHVLDTPASKMKVKGISSVRSHVANLKEYLPQFKSLDELQAKLSEIRCSPKAAAIRAKMKSMPKSGELPPRSSPPGNSSTATLTKRISITRKRCLAGRWKQA